MLLRALFWLILLLGCVSGTDRFEGILKKVGKRFFGHPVVRLKTSSVWSVNRQVYEDFMNQTEAKVNEIKADHVREISYWLLEQSSTQLDFSDDMHYNLMAILDINFVAELCGSREKLNAYQFGRYLKMQRGQFKAYDETSQLKTVLFPTGKDSLRFQTSFQLPSKWGYKSTMIYNLTLGLNTYLPQHRLQFGIVHIELLGGCTEIGTVDVTQTDSKPVDLEEWHNNPDVHALFKLFTPGPMRYAHQDVEIIPQLWLMGLDDEEYVATSVCQTDWSKTQRYTKEQFLSWYQRFGMTWHPKKGDENYMKVQVLKHVPNVEMVARVTATLQPGTKKDAPVHEWNMKIVTEFNKHGDQKWYVTVVDIGCPPTLEPDLMKLYYGIIPEITAEAITSMIHDDVMWQNCLDFLKVLIKNEPIEMESCGEQIYSIKYLQLSLWHKDSPFNATIIYYVLLPPDRPLESTKFSMNVLLYSNTTTPPTHVSTWDFHVQWDHRDQFYYLRKIVFGCPQATFIKASGYDSQKWKIGVPESFARNSRILSINIPLNRPKSVTAAPH